MINTKICRKCGRELDISCFRIRGEGGVPKRINIDCKECVKKDDKITGYLNEKQLKNIKQP